MSRRAQKASGSACTTTGPIQIAWSNAYGGHSGHTYALTRRPDGKTDIDYVVVREGKNLKGRVLSIVLGTVGKGVLKTAFENAVRAIEARNDGANTPALS